MKKILIAEDDDIVRETVVEMLQLEFPNVEIVEAVDGEEAMARLKEFVAAGKIPDVIISDYKMPKRGGLELVKFMKAHQMLNSVPIIIMSAYDAEILEPIMGCEFLEKPFDFKELCELLPT